MPVATAIRVIGAASRRRRPRRRPRPRQWRRSAVLWIVVKRALARSRPAVQQLDDRAQALAIGIERGGVRLGSGGEQRLGVVVLAAGRFELVIGAPHFGDGVELAGLQRRHGGLALGFGLAQAVEPLEAGEEVPAEQSERCTAAAAFSPSVDRRTGSSTSARHSSASRRPPIESVRARSTPPTRGSERGDLARPDRDAGVSRVGDERVDLAAERGRHPLVLLQALDLEQRIGRDADRQREALASPCGRTVGRWRDRDWDWARRSRASSRAGWVARPNSTRFCTASGPVLASVRFSSAAVDRGLGGRRARGRTHALGVVDDRPQLAVERKVRGGELLARDLVVPALRRPKSSSV